MKILNCISTTLILFTGLMFAACSQDEMTDGNALLEGKYPLEIASVSVIGESTAESWGTNGVQSRVAESDDRDRSLWEDGDQIGVGIEGYSASDNGTYKK